MGLGAPSGAIAVGRVVGTPARLCGLGSLLGETHGVGPRAGQVIREGDRVCVILTGQADPAENGPWIAQSGDWERPGVHFEEDERLSEIVAGTYPRPGTKEGALAVMPAIVARLVWDAEHSSASLSRFLVDGIGDERHLRSRATKALWRVGRVVEAFRSLPSLRYDALPAGFWDQFSEGAAAAWDETRERGAKTSTVTSPSRPICLHCGCYMRRVEDHRMDLWQCTTISCSSRPAHR